MTKILIVGQGIAGTALAWALRQRGAAVQLTDGGFPHSASSVAAGIINPVTGKRFVKSWRLEEFFPAARSFYAGLEAHLSLSIWHETPILRLLPTPQEANDWSARCALPDYAGWLAERADAGAWSAFLPADLRFGVIHQAARVDFSALLPAFRQKARDEGWFSTRSFDYQELAALTGEFDYVICCEGWRGRDNPFFPALPWQLAKGEAFQLRFPDQPPGANVPNEILKKEALIAPLGDGLYWAGATYNWTFDDEKPTAGERDFLLARLRDMLAVPFEVIDHQAGIRPTVKDRRPFLGLSTMHPKIGIFNGLGTKGALLAPFWAEHFAHHLLHSAPLDPQVDIRRFIKA